MKRLKNRRGTTLVELLVTFALFAIFMTAAIAVVTPATQLFLKIKFMSYAQNVSTMVMSKIEDEIAMATGSVVVDTSGEIIAFEDSYGTALYITADAGDRLMKIHYRGKANDDGVIENAVDWKYDAKAYQGFQIKTLQFAPASGEKAVKITMELYNEARDITYQTEKVIECYNLEAKDTVTTDAVAESP